MFPMPNIPIKSYGCFHRFLKCVVVHRQHALAAKKAEVLQDELDAVQKEKEKTSRDLSEARASLAALPAELLAAASACSGTEQQTDAASQLAGGGRKHLKRRSSRTAGHKRQLILSDTESDDNHDEDDSREEGNTTSVSAEHQDSGTKARSASGANQHSRQGGESSRDKQQQSFGDNESDDDFEQQSRVRLPHRTTNRRGGHCTAKDRKWSPKQLRQICEELSYEEDFLEVSLHAYRMPCSIMLVLLLCRLALNLYDRAICCALSRT